MPYILNKTNGVPIATVQDASLDRTTDLVFLGKNYAGYGEVQNENFLKLLENFANTTPPLKRIDGQIWFDSRNKNLNVFDGRFWKSVANLEVATTDQNPSVLNRNPVTGDLWFNTDTSQLNIFDGTEFAIIGPPVGADIRAQWKGDFEYDTESLNLPIYNIKAVIGSGEEVVAIVSNETYTMPDYDLSDVSPSYPVRTEDFTRIVKGITLAGTVATTSSGFSYASSRKELTGLEESLYFWGTAAESLYSLKSTTASFSSGLTYTIWPGSTNERFYVPFMSKDTAESICFADSGVEYEPFSGVLHTIASSARYADLAERYHADAYYEPGTVLVIGGSAEVTMCHLHGDVKVAGIVSKNPAYRMNEAAGSDETHPLIALKGRVPCKVIGPIAKGDLLVTSSYPGYAEKATDNDSPNAIIGKALENFEGSKGTIEVKV
jgi:hypothetical protein